MKVLVTGINGQLGFDVVQEGKKRGFDIIGVGRAQLDITIEEDVSKLIKELKPDAIIHCAAYTAVDKAEENRATCWDVNVNGSKNLALSAKKIGAKFIYISTDYVFNGSGKEPFKETDKPAPLNFYGLTKFEGEKTVRSILDKLYIVRVSWVFGKNGSNFIKTMLSLSENKNEVDIVGDQYGSPTYTYDLSRLLIDMIQEEKYGIYHASNEGFCTWAEFAKEIFKETNKDVRVNSILTSEYPTLALRPLNSRMSKQKLIDNGFVPLPSWQSAIKHYLDKYNAEVE